MQAITNAGVWSALTPVEWGIAAGIAVVLVVLLLVLITMRRRPANVIATLDQHSLGRLSNVVLPRSDDGDIMIEHILLRGDGIKVIDVRSVRGIIFAGDRMQDWTVMDRGRRFTIANPQSTLLDRLAAVRQAAPNVPVDGVVVFDDKADFRKGRPSSVIAVSELPQWLGEHHERDPGAQLKEVWTQLREFALDWRD
ncbi:MAG: nuclease-related domain-containing protein [Pseudomonadota bacterium]